MITRRKRGSTRRWRRVRALILGRDATACQVPRPGGPPPTPGSWAHTRGVDAICGRLATHVDHAEEPREGRPLDQVGDLDDLRATCSDHNLRKGNRPASEFDHQADAPAASAATRWEW